MHNFLNISFLVFALLIPYRKAYAFAEDLCYKNGAWVNCMQAAGCGPNDGSNVACLSRVLLSYASTLSGAVRSMVHTDAVFLMAQALGYTAEAAYWLAAYNEATDLGTYIPTDLNGKKMSATSPYATADISGWSRSSSISGGTLAHFPIYFGENETVNGVAPDLHDHVHEGNLFHMRQWALYGNLPGCIGGLTNFDPVNQSYFTGSACYQNVLQEGLKKGIDPATIPQFLFGSMPLLSLGTDQTFVTLPSQGYSGRSIVQYTKATELASRNKYISTATFDSDLTTLLSKSPGRMNGKPVPASLVRLSVYLHSLMDRISHHKCIDDSPVAPPNADGTWNLDFSSPHCSQDQHSYNHFLEVGISPLPERTYSALRYTYRELALFAELHPEFLKSSRSVVSETQILGTPGRTKILDGALQIPDACRRLQQMRLDLQKLGLAQMPGQTFGNSLLCPKN